MGGIVEQRQADMEIIGGPITSANGDLIILGVIIVGVIALALHEFLKN